MLGVSMGGPGMKMTRALLGQGIYHDSPPDMNLMIAQELVPKNYSITPVRAASRPWQAEAFM